MRLNPVDSDALRVQLIRMEAKVSDKISAEDVDPSLLTLNEQLGVAREEAKRVADAAADSWSALQAAAADALATLRASAEEAAAQIEQEIMTSRSMRMLSMTWITLGQSGAKTRCGPCCCFLDSQMDTFRLLE